MCVCVCVCVCVCFALFFCFVVVNLPCPFTAELSMLPNHFVFNLFTFACICIHLHSELSIH